MAIRVPFYDAPPNPQLAISASVKVHMMEIVSFLRFIVDRDDLQVATYLDQMGQDPFFLVAATGLGKTVAVPVHELIRQAQHAGNFQESKPRVWVIEPRIPIATDQAKFMNGLWRDFQTKQKRKRPPLFGVITSASGNVNRDAPIKFVTTGIFGLLTKKNELDPDRDRILIDEAHVTIEQNPEVELGIALARQAGVTVDYMSATVDTSNLQESLGVHNIIRADKARHVIWKHNLLLPVEEALPDLIGATLVHPDPSSEYFPSSDFHQSREVQQAVLESGRSHGMLVVVNSFAGEQSDTERLAALIRKHHPDLAVLQLASEVIRDVRRERAFYQQLKSIESQNQNYVILATSVVEMGVTFSTLDYVVTMDSGYDQETVGDVTFPVIAPLGVNSLLQRMGRVGRRRPGIAYITREIGADYAELEDRELNRGALSYEPIRFPMTSAPLMPLAYYLCKHGCEDIYQSVEDLELPSNLHLNADRMEYLQEQFDELAQLGLATDGHLTPLGTNMEQWIGQADLAYSVQLQRRFNEGARFPEVMFWVVATALSTTPISALRARYSYFVDYEGQHSELPHAVDLFSGVDHEDLASFSVMCWLGDLMPWLLWPINSGTRPVEEEDLFELAKFCNVNGLDSRKLRQAAKAIANTWKLFSRVNRDSERFRTSFNSKLEMSGVYWRRLRDDIPVAQLATALRSLPGQTSVRLSYNEAINAFEWYDDKHGHQGTISQDDSPIRLTDGVELLVRIIPSREGKGADTTWRLAHIGVAPVRVIPPPPPPVRTFYPRQAPASYPPTPPVPVGYYPVPPTNTAPEQNFIHPHPAPSWWDRVKKWFSE